MKTVPNSRSRRDSVDLPEVASRAGTPLVATRRGKRGARVLPFPGAHAQQEPAGAMLKDRMEFAGDGTSPVEASWYGQHWPANDR